MYGAFVMYERQNEDKALTILRASVFCWRKERLTKYAAIFFAVAICLAGITNQYIGYVNAQWFILGSGIILVFNEFLLHKASRFRIEASTLADMYDDHVYGLLSNRLITYPMDMVKIERYAGHVRNRRGKYNNHYFKTRYDADARNAIFENQYKYFALRYKLVLFSRGFMYAIWASFGIAVIACCAALDYTKGLKFLDAFTNIIIPSLSVIFLITQSWRALHYDALFFSNSVTRLNKIRKEVGTGESSLKLSSTLYLRSVQDAVFESRSGGNTFPAWVEKLFEMHEAHLEKKRIAQKKENSHILEPRRKSKKHSKTKSKKRR
jgi:hypothetical protein